MRVAAIDIGTNTVLLLVAERAPSGELRAVAERATITRLGAGVDRTRALAPDAIERTRDCIDEYAREIRALGVQRVAVVGTSAMRDASGSEGLRAHVRAAIGVDVRVASGDEEARLSFRGATSGLALDARADAAVFDIGGGSTEVVIGRVGATHVSFAQSFDVGSVRMTERYVSHDPPVPAELEAITRAAREAFAHVPPVPSADAVPIGIAGTMTTLAAVSLALAPYHGARVHGHVMPRSELARVVAHIESIDVEARRRVAGMEPKRADVIAAGGRIALALVEHWGAAAVVISDRGVRWGLAEELLAASQSS